MATPDASGELERLRIESYTDPHYDENKGKPKRVFTVQFNPASYVLEHALSYEKKSQGKGTTALPHKYKHTPPAGFSLSFTLDGTGAAAEPIDVPARLKDFMDTVHTYDGSVHRPPYLKVAWGKLCIRCVLSKATVRHTLFSPQGTPLRVVVTASFLLYESDKRAAARRRNQSPDVMHRHRVVAGETLPLLCRKYYDDTAFAPLVARHNGLDDLLDLEPGSELLFPPLTSGGAA